MAQKELRAKAIELVYTGHIDGQMIIDSLKDNKYGIYKCFVKQHTGICRGKPDKAPHTHVGIILREKPSIHWENRKEFFKVGQVGHESIPNLVEPLGKGNTSPLKKLDNYVSYMCDGHDNGRYKDTWNYKYDHELSKCNKDARVLLLLSRGNTLRQIIDDSDWNFRAYIFKNKTKIDIMVNNYRKHNRDDTVYHEIEEFLTKPSQKEALTELEAWDSARETLILQGPSNQGKTELAKAILKKKTGKNPLFCSNLNKLAFRDAHQPFILDDMNFNRVSRSKGIHLMDIENERDIRILFGIHSIDAGTPRIFTTNENANDFLPYGCDTDIALKRRYRWIDLTKYGRLY